MIVRERPSGLRLFLILRGSILPAIRNSLIVLGAQNFQGNVFGKHMALSGIEPDHFRRWLGLFFATTERLFEPQVAQEFQVVGKRIAHSLQYGYFGKVVVAGPGQAA